MTKRDVALLTWTKSSRSDASGGCIEIAHIGKIVLVRDSKDKGGPILTFPISSWRAFVVGLVGAANLG